MVLSHQSNQLSFIVMRILVITARDEVIVLRSKK